MLDERLAEVVRAGQIEPHMAEWIEAALRGGTKRNRDFREGKLNRLKRRYQNLQSRIDKTYGVDITKDRTFKFCFRLR